MYYTIYSSNTPSLLCMSVGDEVGVNKSPSHPLNLTPSQLAACLEVDRWIRMRILVLAYTEDGIGMYIVGAEALGRAIWFLPVGGRDLGLAEAWSGVRYLPVLS